MTVGLTFARLVVKKRKSFFKRRCFAFFMRIHPHTQISWESKVPPEGHPPPQEIRP